MTSEAGALSVSHHLVVGKRVSLVRWFLDRDGQWRYETVHGIYTSGRGGVVRAVVDDEERVFDPEQWQVFST